MPPKPKCTKEEIVEAAYSLMEKMGLEFVTARDIGKKLNTTTTPIFTYFAGMDELKEAVYQKALTESSAYIKECIHYMPAFKEFGMRWIRYAYEHPNVYKLVYMMEGISKPTIGFINKDFVDMLQPMTEEVRHNFHLSEEDASILVNEMCIHAQGIAALCVQNAANYDEKQISESLGQVCLSLVMGFWIKNNSLDMNVAQKMLLCTGNLPKRISEEN